jgi:hypothetical protein
VLINPFITAYLNDAMEQLEGQDFTLDINNPAASKIFCMGSNPQKV